MQTELGPISEQTILDMFVPSEKHTSSVLAIDEGCVFICKSVFLPTQSAKHQKVNYNSSYVEMVKNPDSKESMITSFNLVICNESYADHEMLLNKISFFAGFLEMREKSEKFLSTQIEFIQSWKNKLMKLYKD